MPGQRTIEMPMRSPSSDRSATGDDMGHPRLRTTRVHHAQPLAHLLVGLSSGGSLNAGRRGLVYAIRRGNGPTVGVLMLHFVPLPTGACPPFSDSPCSRRQALPIHILGGTPGPGLRRWRQTGYELGRLGTGAGAGRTSSAGSTVRNESGLKPFSTPHRTACERVSTPIFLYATRMLLLTVLMLM
jgi:hypothetical protein